MKLNKLLTFVGLVGAMGLVGCKPATQQASFGLGYDTSYADSHGTMEADYTAAAVVFDANGKVVAAKLDVAQVKVNPTKVGEDLGLELKGYTEAKLRGNGIVKTKLELGELYGMKGSSALGLEVNDQINNFVAWTVGKSVAEIKGAFGIDGKTTDEALAAGCSINCKAFVAAYVKAQSNAKTFTYAAKAQVEAGVAISAGLAYNYGKPAVEISADLAGTAKVDGKVVAAMLDVSVVHPVIAEEEVKDDDGNVTGTVIKAASIDKTHKYHTGGHYFSKRDLGDDYKMASKNGGNATCTLEWYEQAAIMEEAALGKTSEEIGALKGKEGELASVTITATGLVSTLALAAK